MTEPQDITNQLSEVSEAYGNGSQLSTAGPWDREWLGIESNLSIRRDYNISDYQYYHPAEVVPTNERSILRECMKVYEKVFVIKNVVDMMADFTIAGIRITHPNPSIQSFFDVWAKKVDFVSVSERIVNMLYRAGNAPINIRYGKVPSAMLNRMKQTFAADSEDIRFKNQPIEKNRIPWSYRILNPLSIEIKPIDFYGNKEYCMKLPMNFNSKLVSDDIKKRIKDNKYYFKDDSFVMLHYKKDDWKLWAMPFYACILDNIFMLEKMHLADISALNGAISNVRLWRVGDLQHNVLPSRALITKIRNMLAAANNGPLDMVTGPEVDFKESSSNVYRFLGSEKYKQTMTEIYGGIGIPASLIGGDGERGFTNNYVSLKTLIEKLEYVRNMLVGFWEAEFTKIQLAFGWKQPATLQFDYKVLSDEQAYNKLLMDLYDRDIISSETLQKMFRINSGIENDRINREIKKRDKGKMPEKVGPYYKPGGEEDMPGEDVGRPLGEKDSVPRKKRKPQPRKISTGLLHASLWYENTEALISEVLANECLSAYNKKNMRQLTADQYNQFQQYKFNIMSHVCPNDEISEEVVYKMLANADLDRPNKDADLSRRQLMQDFRMTYNREPSTSELRKIHIMACLEANAEILT